MHIVHRGKGKRIGGLEKKLLKRRHAIEPIIGHLKSDHRMDRKLTNGCSRRCARGLQDPLAATHDREERRGLPAGGLFASASDRRAIGELVLDGAPANYSRTQQVSPAFGLGVKLNKSKITN